MSGRVMVDSNSRLSMAYLTGQSPPDSSFCFGPRSAQGEAGVSDVVCTSKRVIKLPAYASCDNLIVPNSAFLFMPHTPYQVHSPKSLVGNFLFRDSSNNSQSSSGPPTVGYSYRHQ